MFGDPIGDFFWCTGSEQSRGGWTVVKRGACLCNGSDSTRRRRQAEQ